MGKSPTLQVKVCGSPSDGWQMPSRATAGSAGYDLYLAHDVLLSKFPMFVHTGVAVAVPEGYEGQIRARSSAAMRGIHVHFGTIDSDYRGEVKILAWSTSGEIKLEAGERIAQLVIAPVASLPMERVDLLGGTERGAGGFGSTGR